MVEDSATAFARGGIRVQAIASGWTGCELYVRQRRVFIENRRAALILQPPAI